MKKHLAYTERMKNQDELSQSGNELIFAMRELQRFLVDEAEEKGWAGFVHFSTNDNCSKSLVEIYKNEQEYNEIAERKLQPVIAENCCDLIEKLGFEIRDI